LGASIQRSSIAFRAELLISSVRSVVFGLSTQPPQPQLARSL